MKSHLKTLIILAGFLSGGVMAAAPNFYAGFRNLPASVSLYHYKVPDRILAAQVLASLKKAMKKGMAKKTKAMQATGHGSVSASVNIFVLPQLFIFDRKGREIFARTAASNDLNSLLNRVFSSPVPLRGGKPLGSRLSTLMPVGKSSAIAPRESGKFTVLEYWAPWCTYCFAERDQLLAYFRKHSDLPVNWITVNADITKVPDL